jgi:two-component system OmpR family sensor kinase
MSARVIQPMIDWLGSLTARTMLVVLVGISALHAASLWTYQHALITETEMLNEARLADRLLAIKRSVLRAEPERREAVAHDMSGGAIEAHWSQNRFAMAVDNPAGDSWNRLGEHLVKLAPELAQDGLMISPNNPDGEDAHLAVISMRLNDQSWVNVSLLSWTPRPPNSHETLLSTSLMAVGALVIALLLVRLQTKPLSAFVKAAERIAHVRQIEPVAERGPREVRALAAAFNDMQRRITRLIDDRTHALAAVSHDLKTPITRLRFRAEDVGDAELRAAVRTDLDDMERMIDQTLSYLKEERADEEVKPVDMVAILESITGDITDAGGQTHLTGSPAAVIPGRRIALKRAFENLIGNAIKYGSSADIQVEDGAEHVRIVISDKGPGIAPEDRLRDSSPLCVWSPRVTAIREALVLAFRLRML